MKKHHYVPQFLLRNFSGGDSRLQVHRIERDATYQAAVADTGHVNDGHTLYGVDGPNRTYLETRMSALETEAAKTIDGILSRRTNEVSPAEIMALSWFIGLQFLRSRFTLGYLASQLAGDRNEIDRKDVQTGLLTVGLVSYLEAWRNRNDAMDRPKERWNPYAGDLLGFRWRVVRFKFPSLVLSDCFAAQSGVKTELRHRFTPVELRWAMHGIGVPLSECARLTIPLSPQAGLILDRVSHGSRIKAEDFNRYTVYSARDFVAHSVGWDVMNARLNRLMQDRLELQRTLRQAMASSFYV